MVGHTWEHRLYALEVEELTCGWHGQYIGHHHDPIIVLEAVASEDLQIWHCFFGFSGSSMIECLADISYIC
jgi:hypothetical protein